MSTLALSKRITLLSLTLFLSCVAYACTSKLAGDKVSNLGSAAQNQNSQNQNTKQKLRVLYHHRLASLMTMQMFLTQSLRSGWSQF